MKMIDKLAMGIGKTADSFVMLVSVALKSRAIKNKRSKPVNPLLILGNGPSLTDTIKSQRGAMDKYDMLAVNFAANTPVFYDLKPMHYVLADPHFFASDGDANVDKLWTALNSISWPMTLHLPVCESKSIKVSEWVSQSRDRRVIPFNMTPAQGFSGLKHWLMDKELVMPRPRNVMIPAIMAGINGGYRNIYIVGADHTWTRTLSVDNENRVITIQPHFYADSNDEKARVASVYKDIRLHEVLQSMTIAFRSYHEIAAYAHLKGINIVNATPESFIDAFPRKQTL